MSEFAKPCIVCGRVLRNVDVGSTNQPYEGLAFEAHGHYGATKFDPMDGSYLELNICDPCLMDAQAQGRVLWVVIVSRRSVGGRSLAGGASTVRWWTGTAMVRVTTRLTSCTSIPKTSALTSGILPPPRWNGPDAQDGLCQRPPCAGGLMEHQDAA